jgi:hypothetical protein
MTGQLDMLTPSPSQPLVENSMAEQTATLPLPPLPVEALAFAVQRHVAVCPAPQAVHFVLGWL